MNTPRRRNIRGFDKPLELEPWNHFSGVNSSGVELNVYPDAIAYNNTQFNHLRQLYIRLKIRNKGEDGRGEDIDLYSAHERAKSALPGEILFEPYIAGVDLKGGRSNQFIHTGLRYAKVIWNRWIFALKKDSIDDAKIFHSLGFRGDSYTPIGTMGIKVIKGKQVMYFDLINEVDEPFLDLYESMAIWMYRHGRREGRAQDMNIIIEGFAQDMFASLFDTP